MNNKSLVNKKALLGIVLPVITLAFVVVILVYMNSVLNKSVYSERRELLTRLSDSCADIVNYDIKSGEKVQEMLVDAVIYDLPQYDNISEYLTHIGTREDYISYPFFMVDDTGKYYSSDGNIGKIVDTSYYTDYSEEKVFYLSTLPHCDSEYMYLIVRSRLSKPIKTEYKGSEINVEYCGILYDLNGLNEAISSQFTEENNCFIYDENGQMMYKKFGIKLLIEGYNIYSKIHKVHIKYGEKADMLEEKCRNHESVAFDMVIDGKEYYFCSSPLDYNNWSVSFVVDEAHLTSVSGSTFSTVIVFAVMIAILLAVAMVGVTMSLRESQRQAEKARNASELNKSLEEASRAKTDFLSNMSHDIRTPINGIMGMTTIAKNVPDNPPKTTECLNKIEGASNHLLSLINDVLDMSRIERGKTHISAESVDVKSLCENCANIVRGQMNGRDLELILEMNCEHNKVIGDPLHLRQIFINILGNAVKFTLDGGKITFRAIELDSDDTNVNYSFEIEDTGIGMAPEFIPKIFDSFSQEGNKDRTNYKGTGLGMAITKQLTELMGGTVLVESEVDVGSKFTVNIPFVIDINVAEEDDESETADIAGLKILLVEDNELNMDIATELLSSEGAIITPAENGQIAVDLFSEKPAGTFDIILMDVMMPVMNGYEATETIRSMEREDARAIPIVAMTANAFEDDIKATQKAGMNAHLSKPINIDEVIKTIAKFGRKQ